MDWQPIETAPKEPHDVFLVYFPEDDDVGWGDCICEAWRMSTGELDFGADGEYRAADGITPTHWTSRTPPEDKPT